MHGKMANLTASDKPQSAVSEELFSHRKVRYHGSAKNVAQLSTLFVPAKLAMRDGIRVSGARCRLCI
jgi:hypothetical protein